MYSKGNLLTLGCGDGKYSVFCKAPSKGVGDKSQIHSNLVFEFGPFLKGKNKEAGVNRLLATFLNHTLGSQDVSGLRLSGQAVHGLGVWIILPWRNNENDDVYNFSTLTILSATAILVI